MNDPQPLPRPIGQKITGPEVSYALSEPRIPPGDHKRAVRARQDVMLSCIGRLEAGATYLISYKDTMSPEYLFGLVRSLTRVGDQFDPPVSFVYLSDEHAALRLFAANEVPTLLHKSALHQSAHDRKERYFPPAE